MKDKLLGPNNKLSKNLRVAILIAGIVLLILDLFTIDYNQLFSRENLGAALGILSALFIIAAMVISLRHTANNSKG